MKEKWARPGTKEFEAYKRATQLKYDPENIKKWLINTWRDVETADNYQKEI